MLRQIEQVVYKTARSLYWNEFGYKVWIEKRLGCGAQSYLNWNERPQLTRFLINRCPKDKSLFRHSTSSRGFAFYFKTEEHTNAFLDAISKSDLTVRTIEHPQDPEHVALLQSDPTLRTRGKLWHNKFQWRIKFQVLPEFEARDLKEWAAAVFGEPGTRYHFHQVRNRSIIYFSDDDDVLVTKLAQSVRIRKVEQAAALPSATNLNNNNNKVGNLDEPSTVSQTG